MISHKLTEYEEIPNYTNKSNTYQTDHLQGIYSANI